MSALLETRLNQSETVAIILSAINTAGTSLAPVEQNIFPAIAFADRVYCLQEARISLAGKPSALTCAQIHAAYFGTDQ